MTLRTWSAEVIGGASLRNTCDGEVRCPPMLATKAPAVPSVRRVAPVVFLAFSSPVAAGDSMRVAFHIPKFAKNCSAARDDANASGKASDDLAPGTLNSILKQAGLRRN